MNQSVLNPIQLHLLKMFSYMKDEEQLLELKKVLCSYYAQKIDEEMDVLWEEGKIDAETIEQWGKEHINFLIFSLHLYSGAENQ